MKPTPEQVKRMWDLRDECRRLQDELEQDGENDLGGELGDAVAHLAGAIHISEGRINGSVHGDGRTLLRMQSPRKPGGRLCGPVGHGIDQDPFAKESRGRIGKAKDGRLTKPQIEELHRLAKGSQPTYGSARARVQNSLYYGGRRYVRFLDIDGREIEPHSSLGFRNAVDRCEITDAGRQALSSIGGAAQKEHAKPARA